jgi:PAS domain S-box-containing protein
MEFEKKNTIVQFIKKWGIFFILTFATSIFLIDIYESYNSFKNRSERMRVYYVTQQKQEIKQQVIQVVNMIRFQLSLMEKRIKKITKERGILLFNLINNIYMNNRGKKSDKEIKKIIINNLRNIKFNIGKGGCFIDSIAGKIILYPANPSLEGKNILNLKNSNGEFIVKKEFEELKKRGELTKSENSIKPYSKNKKYYKKIVNLHLFKPFNWVIGNFVYIDSIEKEMETELLKNISNIRFGKEGYIFLNRYNGDALVSNGKIFSGKRKLWQVFSKHPNKMKELFKKEYNAAQKPEGGYIYYSFVKLSSPNKESPKSSFILGIPELKWIVGSGVYLDDVENDIRIMQKRLSRDIIGKIFYFLLIIVGVIIIFLLLLNKLTNKLKNDFNLFISFFNQAVYSNKSINIEELRFQEFKTMAVNANKMLDEKNRFQNELVNEKEQLFVTIRSIGDGVITTNTKGQVIIMNKVAEKLTGWELKEAKGKNLEEIFNIINKNTGKKIMNPVEKVLKKGEIIELANHTILLSKNNKEHIIEDSAAPIKDKQGNILGVILVFRDVTEKLRTEEQLIKAKKLESVGILAGGIAHDFNNILMGVFGNLEIAKIKMKENHPAYKFIETANNALERATNLTKQLLTFAKGGDPVLNVVDLESLVIKTVDFNLAGSNIKANYKFPSGGLWRIKADKGQISQVISNIIINAKEAMPEGGNIYIKAENIDNTDETLSAGLKGDYIKLSIRDEGIGISRKHIDKIFDPYFTTKQTGSGLGLATAHSIIKKHKGYIKVESTVDKGTVFTLYIPSIKDKTIYENIDKKASHKENFKNRKILIMDDEKIIRDVASEMFKTFGCKIETAKDGKEAIDKFNSAKEKNKPFDLIIMDLTIPGGLGGKETIKKILEIDSEAKVIVSSGYSTDPIMANYKDYGFKGRLVKPFQLDTLEKQLLEILS